MDKIKRPAALIAANHIFRAAKVLRRDHESKSPTFSPEVQREIDAAFYRLNFLLSGSPKV
jgi:hypothetical protein